MNSKINQLIDDSLNRKNEQTAPRDYLGASRLGVNCSRALQYEYAPTPRDKAFSGKTLRIFEMGHAVEKMALNWLKDAGFAIQSTKYNQPLGFTAADGVIQGHIDGRIIYAPNNVIACPALWECKSMNAKSWKQTVDKGMKLAHPTYAVQIAIYQAYMELHKNPALFTAVNKDTSEIYHELIDFDAKLAQEASDKAVNILRATQAGEILPRITNDPDYFECRFCDWKNQCWKENV